MVNKTILATAVAITMTTATAGLEIGGTYEGTTNFDVDTSTFTYGQELDLNLTGTVLDNTTSVHATIDDVDSGSTLSLNQLYIETTIQGVGARLGKSESQNGTGLMQTSSAAVNQMELSGDVGAISGTLGTVSGSGDTVIGLRGTIRDVTITAQDVTETDRFITVTADAGAINATMEYQKTSTGTNIGLQGSTVVEGINVTYAQVDVEDAAGVTQNDGILEDISDAVSGKVVRGIILSQGPLTGKLIDKNDTNIYVATYTQGIMEYGYSKTEDQDGVIGAKATFEF